MVSLPIFLIVTGIITWGVRFLAFPRFRVMLRQRSILSVMFDPHSLLDDFIYGLILALALVLLYKWLKSLFLSLVLAFVSAKILTHFLSFIKDLLFKEEGLLSGFLNLNILVLFIISVIEGLCFYYAYILYMERKGFKVKGKEVISSGKESFPKTKILSKKIYFGLMLAVSFVASLYYVVSMGEIEQRPTSGELIFLIIVIPFVIAGIIVGLSLYYKMWKSLQDGHTRITPGKALGFIFIPVFNIYWIFRIIWGFAREYNAFLDRHSLSVPKLPTGFFLIYTILIVVSFIPYVVPFLAFPLACLALAVIYLICDAVNAIPPELYA
ncbi:MAG: hypothetical protein JXB26_13565 [Candidatus Aminicenantes bacterium]|nr:hypothetical protein [Candidatus Aminicenantes bacterium]